MEGGPTNEESKGDNHQKPHHLIQHSGRGTGDKGETTANRSHWRF